jgi:hypothetical protein
MSNLLDWAKLLEDAFCRGPTGEAMRRDALCTTHPPVLHRKIRAWLALHL